MTLVFPSALRADFAAQSGDGREVWRWSAGRLFAQMLEERTLAPGEALTADAEWAPARPGRWVLLGWLAALDAPPPARHAVEIPAP